MGFVGFLGADNAAERIAGFRQAVEGSGVSQVDGRGDDVDFARAPERRRRAGRQPRGGLHRGLLHLQPPKIYEALQAVGRLGEITVISFDEDPLTLGAVREGTLEGTFVRYPYSWGYEGMKLMAVHVSGDMSGAIEDGLIIVPTKVSSQENLDVFEAELLARVGG